MTVKEILYSDLADQFTKILDGIIGKQDDPKDYGFHYCPLPDEVSYVDDFPLNGWKRKHLYGFVYRKSDKCRAVAFDVSNHFRYAPAVTSDDDDRNVLFIGDYIDVDYIDVDDMKTLAAACIDLVNDVRRHDEIVKNTIEDIDRYLFNGGGSDFKSIPDGLYRYIFVPRDVINERLRNVSTRNLRFLYNYQALKDLLALAEKIDADFVFEYSFNVDPSSCAQVTLGLDITSLNPRFLTTLRDVKNQADIDVRIPFVERKYPYIYDPGDGLAELEVIGSGENRRSVMRVYVSNHRMMSDL